jgi:uncharacterized protein YheU (UPF0270 family)
VPTRRTRASFGFMKNERGTDLPASPRSSSHDADSSAEIHGVELAPDDLSPDALRGLVEEFVSREGTDYGHADRALEGKVAEVYRQLESGEARIVFDLESETASIVSARDLPSGGSR